MKYLTGTALSDASFVFERGVLVEIQNYFWNGIKAGRSSYIEEELRLGFGSSSASLSAMGSRCGVDTCLDVYIDRSNLPINFSVIEPWENPSHKVPEPTSLLASGLALGSLLLKKRR
ncbi:MAG: PEP-CTERM sorting domain-containing protein [Geitlerinemataceae cyanobacterium]